LGDRGFKASPGQKKNLALISISKPGVVVHICNHSYTGGIGRRITI
jgi:hypothetical protein